MDNEQHASWVSIILVVLIQILLLFLARWASIPRPFWCLNCFVNRGRFFWIVFQLTATSMSNSALFWKFLRLLLHAWKLTSWEVASRGSISDGLPSPSLLDVHLLGSGCCICLKVPLDAYHHRLRSTQLPGLNFTVSGTLDCFSPVHHYYVSIDLMESRSISCQSFVSRFREEFAIKKGNPGYASP